MIGVPPGRATGDHFSTFPRVGRRAAARLGVCVGVLAVLAFLPGLRAQSNPDLPAQPIPPEGTPLPSVDTNPPGPSPLPDDAASPLLPSTAPLPPRPSIPPPDLLPDSTPSPAAPLPPLPLPAQTGSALSPAATGVPAVNGAPGTTPDTALSGAATTTNTGTVRRFGYAFRLNTGVSYDDNVFLTPNASSAAGSNSLLNHSPRHDYSRADVLFSLAPSVSLGYGDFLARTANFIELDYTLDAILYTRNTNQDALEHLVNLSGAYHFSEVTFTLSQDIQILNNSTDINSVGSGSQLGGTSGATPVTASQVNLDASQRTNLDVFTTRLTGNYSFSDKTSVDLDGYFSAYDYSTLVSSDTLSVDLFFNYSLTGKITLGLGVTGGYVIQSDPAPDEYYEQANLRASYNPTGKLSFSGSVGLEARETSGVSGTDVTPVFDLSISYNPFDSTSLALSATRRVDTSAVLTGENFNSTGFTFTANQRFFQRAFARLSFGYTHSGYVSSGRGASIARDDDYYFVQPSLDYQIRDNLSVGLFYVRRQDSSSLSDNSFRDNQVGAHLSLSF